MRNDSGRSGSQGAGLGFARPARDRVTLADIRAVHGSTENGKWPAFSRWYRSTALRSVSAFVEISGVSVARLQELTGLIEPTARALIRAERLPYARTLCKLISAGIIDMVDAAPNVAYARQLKPVRNRVLGAQGPLWNWGVAEALVAWRKARGHSQRDCAPLFGIDQQRLSRWERGHQLPGPALLARLVELHVIDRATACAILDSDHYPASLFPEATRAVLAGGSK